MSLDRLRQRERDVGIDMGEVGAVDARSSIVTGIRGRTSTRPSSASTPSCTTAMRSGTSTCAGAAGRTGDDAALDADLHGHDAGVEVALARGAHDGALIAHVERRGSPAPGLLPIMQRRGAGAHCRRSGQSIVGVDSGVGVGGAAGRSPSTTCLNTSNGETLNRLLVPPPQPPALPQRERKPETDAATTAPTRAMHVPPRVPTHAQLSRVLAGFIASQAWQAQGGERMAGQSGSSLSRA